MAERFPPNTLSLYGQLSSYPQDKVEQAYNVLHSGGEVTGNAGWKQYRATVPYPFVGKNQGKLADLVQYAAGADYLRNSGLDDPRREVWSFNGPTRYERPTDRVYINPRTISRTPQLGIPVLKAHEQYHAFQNADPAWKAVASMDSGPRRRLASEFAPSLLNVLLPAHGIAGEFGEGALRTPVNPLAYAKKQGTAPYNMLPTPAKDFLPYSKLQAVAAQKGVFGPTPASRKYGYTGNGINDIETLLNTPEGRQWMQMFMNGNQ